MRVNDEPAFRDDEFPNELAAMARHKMVIPYQEMAVAAGAKPRWTFRHDKIMDYFLVRAFLGEDNPRPTLRLDDPRFRGTYLQLANLLPIGDAENLERELIDYAADTKDHSLSDTFVQLLRTRRGSLSQTYCGAMRSAPSRRMVSPFSIGLSRIWRTR
jgi:hypothetical protein